MNMTRDQLRAARMLLHLKQDALAVLSQVGVATIRRFETGSDIRPPQLEALRNAVERAGAVLVDGTAVPDASTLGVGVILRRTEDLPDATRARIAAEEARDAERIGVEKRRLEERLVREGPRRRPGRPKKHEV